MRVLSVVHQEDAGPGVFGVAAAARGHELVEWVPRDAPPPALDGFDAAMVFGGAMNVDEEDSNPWLRPEKELLRGLLGRGTPILGVCLGAQLLAEAAGASPGRAREPEIGWLEVALERDAAGDPVFGGLPERFEGFEWHSYEAPLPPGAVPLARTPVCLQGYRLANGGGWGIQFHAEVTRDDLGLWLDDYRSDPDAARVGLDPDALRAETARKIDGWNETGRQLCARFLRAVEH